MNYAEIQRMASQGVEFFSDGDGTFQVVRGEGRVEMVDGVEVSIPAETFSIKGLVRDVKDFEIGKGEILAGDKRGVFPFEPLLKVSDRVIIDGESYRVINPRYIKPTGTVVAQRPLMRKVAVYG